jgi:RHS repeat-associated protein
VGTLQKVTLPNNQTVEYELDAAGRRVGRNLNGVKQKGWLYDGALRVIAQTDAGGSVTQRYVYATQGHSPDYVVAGNSTYRIVKDTLGSVRLVVDTVSGEVKQRIDCDVWGKVTSNSNPGFQPFGFAGGLLDSDTELTRFGAREYDAESGRWASKDPIGFAGEDSNLFAYVAKQPLDFVDPTGLDLHVAWQNYLRYDRETLEKLERAVADLNSPSVACKCALTTGGGYGELPWANRWISVMLSPELKWRDASGLTDFVQGVIYVDPSLAQSEMTATIAHEGGHLRWPYLGHDNYKQRFGDPMTMCNSNFGALSEGYLKENPSCGCQ